MVISLSKKFQQNIETKKVNRSSRFISKAAVFPQKLTERFEEFSSKQFLKTKMLIGERSYLG